MAYDETMAARIRHILEPVPGVTERKMFGGLGFMVDGHMAVAAGSQGAMMLRVDPEMARELIDGERILPQEMQGRTLAGWLHVEPSAISADDELRRFVELGVNHVRTLPPKH